MRLTDLNPKITPGEDGVRRLSFNCPCGCSSLVGIRIGTIGTTQENGIWSCTGEFPETLSTQPSILVYPHKMYEGECKGWHGYLVNGEMKAC